MTIITAFIILLGTLSLFSQSSNLRFDGMYQAETEEYSYFLRFYPDNTVLLPNGSKSLFTTLAFIKLQAKKYLLNVPRKMELLFIKALSNLMN
jgi:hypothetical protein